VSEVRRNVLILATASLLGCLKPNDTVLQPDSVQTAGVSAAAPIGAAAVGGSSSLAGSGAAGTGAAGVVASTQAGTSGPQAGIAAPSGGTFGGGGVGPMSEQTFGGASGAAVGAGSGGIIAPPAAGQSAAGGAAGSAAPEGAQDPDCDFNGIWIAKQITVSQALSLPQSSNNWYYLEFKQSGTAVQVSKHFDCGIEVHGSATVSMTRATTQALIAHNVQIGRKATLMKDGANCAFTADRFWSVRGADETRFVPNPTRDSMDSIAMVEMVKPLPKVGATDGAEDTDDDGQLGVAFQVTGIIAGTRNSVQRDWTRWFTDTGYTIPASTNWTSDIVIRADFDNQENVLDPSSGLLTSGSTPKADSKHVLKLRFLGRDKSDPRVAAIVHAADIDTCYAIQDAMPAETLE
jgi:hypothetical protein